MADRQSALFIGHGSPMNALARNPFTDRLREMGQTLARPKAIVMVSAHWYARELKVLAAPALQTIHDFGGFPDELFAVQYPAPGMPELAKKVGALTGAAVVDAGWGLDHGAWSVLRHLYPDADVPVVPLSLDRRLGLLEHFEIGKRLRSLRDEGVMIVGSGNVVHNLQEIEGLMGGAEPAPHPKAQAFAAWFRDVLLEGNLGDLVDPAKLPESYAWASPTPDHYLPVAVLLGSMLDDEEIRIFFDEIQNASISMLSFGVLKAG